ncbi:MAG: hypothetical protein U0Q22_18680 [Acidimicrobiales bacterium]
MGERPGDEIHVEGHVLLVGEHAMFEGWRQIDAGLAAGSDVGPTVVLGIGLLHQHRIMTLAVFPSSLCNVGGLSGRVVDLATWPSG